MREDISGMQKDIKNQGRDIGEIKSDVKDINAEMKKISPVLGKHDIRIENTEKITTVLEDRMWKIAIGGGIGVLIGLAVTGISYLLKS